MSEKNKIKHINEYEERLDLLLEQQDEIFNTLGVNPSKEGSFKKELTTDQIKLVHLHIAKGNSILKAISTKIQFEKLKTIK